MSDIIQFRRGTSALWTSTGTVLASGEIGYETDTGKLKIGTGLLGWNALPYYSASGITSLNDLTDVNLTGLIDGSLIRYNSSTGKFIPSTDIHTYFPGGW